MKPSHLIRFFCSVGVVAGTGISSIAFAESGADLLLRSVKKVGPPSQEIVEKRPQVPTEFKTDDAYLISFFSEWQGGPALPFHVDLWARKILSHDFRGAAHLWSQVRKAVPESWMTQARTAHAYSLWRMGLDQAFWNEWFSVLGQEGAVQSQSLVAFHQILQPQLASWLLKTGIRPSLAERQVIVQLKDQSVPIMRTLNAWLLLRSGRTELARAVQVLETLPKDHVLKIPLAKTVILQLARSGELARAAQVMKEQWEPAILASGNHEENSGYFLQLARLLFQAGNLDAAQEYYLKIPRGASQYPIAHEELSWVYLRKGDLTRLRGEIASFETGVLDQKFLPELQMVSAVSNLKLCFYDRVEKNFASFLKSNGAWAKRISGALAAAEPVRPIEPDFFTLLAETTVQDREAELRQLEILAEESIVAALPAVGVQAHWSEAVQNVKGALEDAKKAQGAEYTRQWKGMEVALREAITKMKFVKLELMTQLSQVAAETGHSADSDQVRVSQSSAVRSNPREQVFRFDGVVWPDELFRLQSATQGRCGR